MHDAFLGVFVVVLALGLTIVGGLVLYALVRAEATNRDVMHRYDAERAARRDDSKDGDNAGNEGVTRR